MESLAELGGCVAGSGCWAILSCSRKDSRWLAVVGDRRWRDSSCLIFSVKDSMSLAMLGLAALVAADGGRGGGHRYASPLVYAWVPNDVAVLVTVETSDGQLGRNIASDSID